MCPKWHEIAHTQIWALLITGTLLSQRLVIDWNNNRFLKNRNPDVQEFISMTRRLVLAVNVSERVLRPASVTENLIDGFLHDVVEGMRHGTLDAVYDKVLDDDFSMNKIRESSKTTLLFTETIIAQQMSEHIGLNPKAVNQLELQESQQMQDSWKNKLLMDANLYVSMLSAHRSHMVLCHSHCVSRIYIRICTYMRCQVSIVQGCIYGIAECRSNS